MGPNKKTLLITFTRFLLLQFPTKMIAQKPQALDPVLAAGKAPKANEPIIVVGGGLAGMAATLEALEAGAAKVILVDKEANLGGNSAKASSGINGCETKVQKRLNVTDSCARFYSDTMQAGDRENDPILVDILVDESASAVQFLIEKGVDLADVNLCGGHSTPRTHWLQSPKEGKPLPVGVAIIRVLKAKLTEWQKNEPEKLEIRLNTPVLGLVTWNDYITGVRIQEHRKLEEIAGKAVILTTGGFSADRDNETSLLTVFNPAVLQLPTTNGPFATGDGVKIARAMGAGLVGMDRVQVHPTAFVDPNDPSAPTKFLAAEALRGKGAILVNEQGKRFGNELGRRDQLTDQINKYCSKQKDVGNLPLAWMLMNNQSAEEFGRPAFTFYSKIKGFFKELASVDELAKEIGCPIENIRTTIDQYNDFVDEKTKDEDFRDPFGKRVFPVKFTSTEPFFVARITPAIHYTMGGLQIDKHAFVFSEFMGKPFQGLLAAGEVTGGVHGHNRLAGNSLLECVVFGRIAGRSAAAINYQAPMGDLSGFAGGGQEIGNNRDERAEL